MASAVARRLGSALQRWGAFGPPSSLRHRMMEEGLVAYHRVARPTFGFQGKRYRYHCHRAHKTWTNERTVEVPLALEVVSAHPAARMLEVGNVLHKYLREPHHDVVDKYEVGPGVLNVDIVDFAPEQRYDLIVTVSTMEHVGWDEEPREPGKVLRAFEHLQDRCLAPGGTLFFTFPLGYNTSLDAALRDGRLGPTQVGFLRKVSPLNEWAETSQEEALAQPYNRAWWCANAVAVGSFTAKDV